MIREWFHANTGIQFYRASLKNIGFDPDTFLEPRQPAIVPTRALVAQVEAVAHVPKPTGVTLVDYMRASPSATASKSEEDEEFVDSLSPKYDRLELSKPWWILEILPIRLHEQNRMNDSWTNKWMYVFVSNTILSHSLGYGLPQTKLGSRTQSARTSH